MSNSRAEALRSFCGSKPSYYRQNRTYGYGSRIPKTTPKPLRTSNFIDIPTHSTSRLNSTILPKNNRLDFLDKKNEDNIKKTFVAMPTKSEWDKGFRPAWILSDKDAPEKYEDGYLCYKNYLKTGEIVYYKNKNNFDKTKQTANQFMNKYSKQK